MTKKWINIIITILVCVIVVFVSLKITLDKVKKDEADSELNAQVVVIDDSTNYNI